MRRALFMIALALLAGCGESPEHRAERCHHEALSAVWGTSGMTIAEMHRFVADAKLRCLGRP